MSVTLGTPAPVGYARNAPSWSFGDSDRWRFCWACFYDSRDWEEHRCKLQAHFHELELTYRERATLDEMRLAGVA